MKKEKLSSRDIARNRLIKAFTKWIAKWDEYIADPDSYDKLETVDQSPESLADYLIEQLDEVDKE